MSGVASEMEHTDISDHQSVGALESKSSRGKFLRQLGATLAAGVAPQSWLLRPELITLRDTLVPT